jgi:hypothetical protein
MKFEECREDSARSVKIRRKDPAKMGGTMMDPNNVASRKKVPDRPMVVAP